MTNMLEFNQKHRKKRTASNFFQFFRLISKFIKNILNVKKKKIYVEYIVCIKLYN